MTQAQKEVFHAIDEWWKKFGFGPSVDDVMLMIGSTSRSNTTRKMRALVEIGMCKATPRRARSIRPAYMKIRNIV